MTIVRATIQHLLRRKWQLPVAVFSCGVALVALHHSFDVDGLRETFFEARRESAASRSPEQNAAMATWGVLGPILRILDGLFTIGPLLVGMLMPGGVVANERRTGAIMLWAQHPMPLRRFYMHRYLGMQTANLAAFVLIGVSFVSGFTLPPGAIASFDRFVESCLLGFVGCAISFAISALGIRRAAFLTFLYFVGSNSTMSAQLRDSSLVSSDMLPFLIFPTGAVAEFMTGFPSDVLWNWGATGLVLYHFTLWTAIAWFGLWRLERRPLKL